MTFIDNEASARAAEHCARSLEEYADEYEAEGNHSEAARLRRNAEGHRRLAAGLWEAIHRNTDTEEAA